MRDQARLESCSSYRFLHVNAHSIKNKTHELAELMYTERVHFCAVTETWMKGDAESSELDEKPPEIQGYTWHGGTARSNRRGGGVGLYIANHIEFTPVRIELPETKIELAVISAHVNGAPRLQVAAVYIPPTVRVKFDLLKRLQLPRTIILGDLNAHNRLWSQGVEKLRGKQLYNFVRSNSMSAFGFRDTPTFLGEGVTPSSPDIILAGREIAPHVRQWRVAEDIGSDHLPIYCEIQIAHSKKQRERVYKWKHKTLDTQKYQKRLESVLSQWRERHPLHSFNASKAYQDFTECTLEACRSACKRGEILDRHGVPWMTKQIRALIKARRKARKRCQKNRTLANWREYKKLAKNVKREVKLAKERERERFHATFTKENTFHKLRQTQPRPKLPHSIERSDGELLATDREIADELCTSFSEVGRPESHQTPHNWEGPAPESKEREFESKITQAEVDTVIEQLRPNKAPGRDGIYPWMIKHGGTHMAKAILHLFQGCWTTQSIPAAWRFADIRPIMKKTSAREAGDFRPISLLPVPSKMYDSVMLGRLQSVSDQREWIPAYQAGFRKHRSAIEHLIQLQQEAHTTFKDREFLVIAFLDISKAYDCVSRKILLQKLEGLGVNGRMLAYLQSFLGRRFASVTYESATSDTHEFQFGVPQGSPISPLLFNIYCADALERCEGGKVMQADDMSVYRKHRSQAKACELLTEDLATVFNFGQSHQLRFSLAKCKVLIVTRRNRERNAFPRVLFGGQVLKVVEKHKYLGVVFDKGLTWVHHVNHIKEKAEIRLRKMLKLCGKKTGVRQQLLIQLYQYCIRPLLEYASEVWGDLSKTRAQALESIQHQALTKMLGVNKYSHKEHVCFETATPPLSVRRDVQILRFWISIHKHPRPLTQYLESLTSRTRLREKQRVSFYERFQNLRKVHNIPLHRLVTLTPHKLQVVTCNLWKRHKREKQSSLTDYRSVKYREVQTELTLTPPKSYNTVSRKLSSNWHELRLGTAPLRWFLTSIQCKETEECICGTGVETVPHFLLVCPLHALHREKMFQAVKNAFNSVKTPTLAQILSTRDKAFLGVTTYLEETDRF